MNLIENFCHGAILKEMRIDRSNPGYNDIISVVIAWNTGLNNIFSFKDVYYASLHLNFGVIADEYISDVIYMPANDNDVQLPCLLN